MPVALTRLETLQTNKLLQCIRQRNFSQIEKLVQNGVPNLLNYNDPNNGETGLTLAVAGNDVEMVTFLIEQGAHPDVVDINGRTPVSRAAELANVECVDVLTKARASMKIKDNLGKGMYQV